MRIEGRGGGAAGDEWAILGTPHGAHLARARTVQNGGEEVRESVVVGVVPQGWLGLEPLQPPFFLALFVLLSLHYRPILCLPVLGVPVVPWCGDRD